MIAAVLFISFALLLVMGAPIAVCLGVSSIAAMLVQGAGRPLDTVMSAMPQMFSSSMSKFVLLAIPYFILAGNIMDKAQISKRLINLAEACVGHLRGGLAIVCVIVSCFFAAISGSGPATVAALGLVMIPGMIRSGYSPSFSAALMASAGAIGVIIPPSITFVVYGSIASGVGIGDLFKAGVIPGLIMGAALIAAALILGRKANLVKLPKASWHDRWVAFKKAFWGLLMPVIILGGIYGGFFTPTEAAAVASIYGIVIGFCTRKLKVKDLWPLLVDSVSQTAVVMLIVGTASLFSYALTLTGIAADASAALISFVGDSKFLFLLIVNIILLIAGCFIDANSAMYIIVPILVPVARALGIDLVHLGCVMVFNLAVGLVTPPVGVNLYVGCGIAGIKLKEICKGVMPLIVASILALLLVTYIKPISMILPNLLGGGAAG